MTPEEIKDHDERCEAGKTRAREVGVVGPWDNEPNRKNWKAHGLDCMLVRGPMLAWCGYVGVKPGHPAFDKDYHNVGVDVHGGLTYAGRCDGHICHIDDEGGEPTYWLGFDCSHSFDLSPHMEASCIKAKLPQVSVKFEPGYQTYRNETYVTEEVEQLAAQLARMK
jgi:hypothetical protein